MERNKENTNKGIDPKNHKKKKNFLKFVDEDFVAMFLILIAGPTAFLIFGGVANNNDEGSVCMLDKEYIHLLECKKNFCESKGWTSTYPSIQECRGHKAPENEIQCLVPIPERGYQEKRIFYFNDVKTICEE